VYGSLCLVVIVDDRARLRQQEQSCVSLDLEVPSRIVLGPVLVAPVPDADERPPVQGVSEVEGATEGPVGGSAEGNREVEAAVEDPGSFRRCEI